MLKTIKPIKKRLISSKFEIINYELTILNLMERFYNKFKSIDSIFIQ